MRDRYMKMGNTHSRCMCRIAPHVTMTLVALEALKAYEKKIGL